MTKRVTAGELSRKALADNTKYDALEVGHALANDIMPHLRECIENHKTIIDENEFCIVMLISKDPLITNLMRRKFYAWPYLPKPRPNQSVFLYNKGLDQITHRLWILPSDMVMAELHELPHVDKRYQTMKAWADAFYKGWKFVKTPGAKDPGKFVNTDPFYFWNYVRADQKIKMPSEHEYFLEHREELIQAGCKILDATYSEAFDFSKVEIKQVVDTQTAVSA
ncbi:hypothetical protein UFOVP256_13 [uncultured Caudovirales phage]|uniref:Uncharacterized protein n=1 Tax=uncultured Caudovirales phage TaxID=2100421 RepID=A0A6J5LHA4_9CAUD|nr:hypothetical protein UFOVP256_13 [uncultured Caudovirales phage]